MRRRRDRRDLPEPELELDRREAVWPPPASDPPDEPAEPWARLRELVDRDDRRPSPWR